MYGTIYANVQDRKLRIKERKSQEIPDITPLFKQLYWFLLEFHWILFFQIYADSFNELTLFVW